MSQNNLLVVASSKGELPFLLDLEGAHNTSWGTSLTVKRYDYTGTREDAGSPFASTYDWSFASPGGGASQVFCSERALQRKDWDYYGGVPHDVWVRVADLMAMARLAKHLGLVAWAPSLSLDSECSYEHQRVRPGKIWHEVPYIEDQCAFFDRQMTEELLPWHRECPSGCGATHYAMPYLLSKRPGARCGVFDFASCWHSEPSRTMHIPAWERDVERARTFTIEQAMAEASRVMTVSAP